MVGLLGSCDEKEQETNLVCDPEVLTVFHDVSQDGTTKEHHVLATWGVLDSNLEFAETADIALQKNRDERDVMHSLCRHSPAGIVP